VPAAGVRRCLTARSPNREAGIASCSNSPTSPPRSTSSAKAEAHFRNDIVTGVGGKQILLEDPSGNPIELFQPTLPEAFLTTPK
jgi:hypothetical protein